MILKNTDFDIPDVLPGTFVFEFRKNLEHKPIMDLPIVPLKAHFLLTI